MTGSFSAPVNEWFRKPIVVENVEVETGSRLLGLWNRERGSTCFKRTYSA